MKLHFLTSIGEDYEEKTFLCSIQYHNLLHTCNEISFILNEKKKLREDELVISYSP